MIIAEYQCDEIYVGQKFADLEFLPLDKENWIVRGNALQLDWLGICPPAGVREVKVQNWALDLEGGEGKQKEIAFENDGGEVFICGNPPYLGSTWQSKTQKADLKAIFDGRTKKWRSLDYVAGWFMKAADYLTHTDGAVALVSTNSICQGQQVPILWPLIFATDNVISFAHTSFKWKNLASHNAGVTVVIVALTSKASAQNILIELDNEGEEVRAVVDNVNAYLVAGPSVFINKYSAPLSAQSEMLRGNMPYDGGNLLLTREEVMELGLSAQQHDRFTRRIYGSSEFIRGGERYCLWIEDAHLEEALAIIPIAQRIEAVKKMREASRDKGANAMAATAHQFREMEIGQKHSLALGGVSSETRKYFPVGIVDKRSTITNLAFALYDAPLWNLALIASKLHLVWIATVCGKLKTDYRYSNTLGWNTFPVPKLTAEHKADLTRSAENILLAREAHFPATIADLYKPDAMPENLRAAHAENDRILEEIYIGRPFKNDTERLEKLFEMYAEMTKGKAA